MNSAPVKVDSKRSVWPDVFLVLLGGVAVLRLVIWKLFLATEIFFREEFSNVVVAAVILFLVVIWAVIKFIRAEPIKKSGLEIPIFLMLGAAACSLLYTADFPSSLMGSVVLGAEVTFLYMLADVLDTPKRMRWALFFFMIMALVVSVYGIKEFIYMWTRPLPDDASQGNMNASLYYVLVNRRVVSFLGWPNSLAGYLLLILPFVLVLPFRLKSLWQRIVTIITWPVFLACFLFTFSFLGWLSLILATLCLMPVFWEKLKINAWSKERKMILLAAVFIFCGLFVWVIFRKNFLMSLTPRILYYKETFALLAQKVFLGHGWGTFGVVSRQFATPRGGHSYDTIGLSTYAHNAYLQVWVEAGIIGFLGVVSLVVLFLRRGLSAIKSIGEDKNALIVMAIVWGLTAFFIDNLFSFTMLKPNIALYGWAMLAVFCAFTNRVAMPPRAGAWFVNRCSAGVVILISALMLGILIRLIGGYVYYYEARYGKRAKTFNHVVEFLRKAEGWDPWSSYLPAASGDLRLRGYVTTHKVGFLKEAEGLYLEAIRRSPQVFSNYYIMGNIYQAQGNLKQANTFFSRARELSPVEFDREREAARMMQEDARRRSMGPVVPVKR